tara:strand:+ start:234 stop:665 length:432 start_codon:yes stop_codon:yes gene_type:complete
MEEFELESFSTGKVSAAARGDPTPDCPVMVPLSVENDIAYCIRAVREMKGAVFRDDVIAWMEASLEGTAFEVPANVNAWYVERQDLTSKALRPLDVKRDEWYTEANLLKHFENVQSMLLKYGYVSWWWWWWWYCAGRSRTRKF